VIVLDTNVVSEIVRPTCAPAVRAWFARRDGAMLYTTTVTEAEVRFGITLMPDGRRRDALLHGMEDLLHRGFTRRILPFDRRAAAAYGPVATAARRSGRTIGVADLLIAAIAVSRGAEAVATRNVTHFEGLGVPVLNPWAML
jgi:predicted nucleic acid-binding protein